LSENRRTRKVRVNLMGSVYEIIGQKTFDVELKGATVRGLLEKMSETYGQDLIRLIVSDSGELHVLILVNGVDIDFIKKLETPLKEGDLIAIVPHVVGG